MSGSSTVDIPKISLYYHPNCRASSKLMNEISTHQDSSKLFNFINISTLNNAPQGLRRIPCVNYDGKLIHGKECFDIVSRLLSGPSSCNIFNTGTKVCSFDNSNQIEFQISPSYSSIDGKNTSDGFIGVPAYNGEVKTIEKP